MLHIGLNCTDQDACQTPDSSLLENISPPGIKGKVMKKKMKQHCFSSLITSDYCCQMIFKGTYINHTPLSTGIKLKYQSNRKRCKPQIKVQTAWTKFDGIGVIKRDKPLPQILWLATRLADSICGQ